MRLSLSHQAGSIDDLLLQYDCDQNIENNDLGLLQFRQRRTVGESARRARSIEWNDYSLEGLANLRVQIADRRSHDQNGNRRVAISESVTLPTRAAKSHCVREC